VVPSSSSRDRLVPLEGTLNFRDLGGYPASGGTTRWGVVYRADKLSELTDADLAHLGGLGIRTVCDFRYDREVDEDPSRLPDGARVVRMAIGSSVGDNPNSLEDLIRAGAITHVVAADVADSYVRTLEQRTDLLRGLVELVADPEHHPVVIHCTAGKDRTGIAAALLLGAVGVDEATIIQDYALTDQYRSEARLADIGPRLARDGIDIENLRVLFTAPAETMELALAGVRERWGGILPYVTDELGVSDATLDALRGAFVE
jgi:protein-tyrosine phosphatase